MKDIKIKYSFLAVLFSSIMLSSCFEEDNFLDDNLTLTGNHFPVIASFSVDTKSVYVINEVVTDAILSYWTEGSIKQINVYNTIGSGTKDIVSTTPYSANFIDSLRTDVFVFDYDIPNVEPRTSIKIEVEVENVNGLTKADDFDISLDVILSGNSSEYAALSMATFDYQYWSGTAIDAIDLVQYTEMDTTIVFTVPVQPAFAGGFILDTYQFNQVLPNLPGEEVVFEVQLIHNAQADTIKSSFTFDVIN